VRSEGADRLCVHGVLPLQEHEDEKHTSTNAGVQHQVTVSGRGEAAVRVHGHHGHHLRHGALLAGRAQDLLDLTHFGADLGVLGWRVGLRSHVRHVLCAGVACYPHGGIRYSAGTLCDGAERVESEPGLTYKHAYIVGLGAWAGQLDRRGRIRACCWACMIPAHSFARTR